MDAVEDIKSRLSIEDVIGEYVELKRAGRNFKALSPFGNEKTPSFMISPEKQIWHDFSTGKGGNMFSFVMEMEGVDFKGALELLARKAGVDLALYRTGSSAKNATIKNVLYDINEAAAKFYQINFSKNKSALEYILKDRAFTKEIALSFRLGYSPNTPNALIAFLQKRGFALENIKKAGLAVQRYGDAVDMFRGRIMVPLADGQGKIVGFTARLLKDEPNAPKYINTPATPLYDKSRHIFGLHLAKEAIRKTNFVVVVEGNMDVIASQQADVSNVVATAGTAMTQMHLKELSKFTSDIRLCFDEDSAGIAATERAIELANGLDINLQVLTVVGGKDPDELIRSNVSAWKQVINKPKYAMDWLIDRYAKEYDVTSAQGKKLFIKKIMSVLIKMSDKVEQEHYVKQIAKLLDVSVGALMPQMAKPKKIYKKGNISLTDTSSVDSTKLQDHLFALLLCSSSLKDVKPRIPQEIFVADSHRQCIAYANKQTRRVLKADAIPQGLQSVSDYVKMLLFIYEEVYSGLEDLEQQHEFTRLQTRVIEEYIKKQKNTIIVQLKNANDSEVSQLLGRAKELDVLLAKTKE